MDSLQVTCGSLITDYEITNTNKLPFGGTLVFLFLMIPNLNSEQSKNGLGQNVLKFINLFLLRLTVYFPSKQPVGKPNAAPLSHHHGRTSPKCNTESVLLLHGARQLWRDGRVSVPCVTEQFLSVDFQWAIVGRKAQGYN